MPRRMASSQVRAIERPTESASGAPRSVPASSVPWGEPPQPQATEALSRLRNNFMLRSLFDPQGSPPGATGEERGRRPYSDSRTPVILQRSRAVVHLGPGLVVGEVGPVCVTIWRDAVDRTRFGCAACVIHARPRLSAEPLRRKVVSGWQRNARPRRAQSPASKKSSTAWTLVISAFAADESSCCRCCDCLMMSRIDRISVSSSAMRSSP